MHVLCVHVYLCVCVYMNCRSRKEQTCRSRTSSNWEPSAPREPVQCHKCHTCHAKCTSMSPSATPATQSGRCRPVPRLPRKEPRRQRCQLRHQSQSSAINATPAMQSARTCHQVPRLPRKVTVDVAKCHSCHAKSRGDNGVNWEPSAPQEPAQCHRR